MGTMKNIVMLSLGVLLSAVSYASDPVDALGVCLTDSLNGKERKTLAQWMFFAQASHPSLASFVDISADDIDKTDREVGQLVTRLLTADCSSLLVSASRANPMALQYAFEFVGRVAMVEMMASPEVTASIAGHAKYTDMVKITELMTSALR